MLYNCTFGNFFLESKLNVVLKAASSSKLLELLHSSMIKVSIYARINQNINSENDLRIAFYIFIIIIKM